ncbi:MAG TPA: single-stranded DNA-binding protein, partial [Chloroflexaceae bacterium]|nr:single-stranded DNA-binding protein [Chloroflexaceae bacterium]
SEPLLYDVGDHPVAALALACQRRWRTPSGTVQLATTWFNLSAWEELAEQCGRQLHHGDRVYVEGYLHLWTETRPPHSYACHTIVLERIVLLAAGGGAAETQGGQS